MKSNHAIAAVAINNEQFPYFKLLPADMGEPLLGCLGKVNLFVGENNSGKSRFLRRLSSGKLTFQPTSETITKVNTLLSEVRSTMLSLVRNGQRDANSLFKKTTQIQPVLMVTEEQDFLTPIWEYFHKLAKTNRNEYIDGVGDFAKIAARISEVGADACKQLEALASPHAYKFQKVYIPALRGLRTLDGVADAYKDRVSKDHFLDAQPPPEILTGLSFYDEYRRMLLGDYKQRRWTQLFEIFLSMEFFQNRRITIIPRDSERVLQVKIGAERLRPISELGDGIHSIIMLTFPLFKYKEADLLVFYEEPETYLHPAYQRLFINLLTSNRFPNHQYFITTHSNHFLDLTADTTSISVYTFRREVKDNQSEEDEHDTEFLIENVSNDSTHTLELLGVRNSSVFLSNCTIWVEGITDRRYLSHFIRLYIASLGTEAFPFREDLHFSFVEYSGGNITHWSFLDEHKDAIIVERLCGKLFLIADDDSAKAESKKGERLRQLEAKLGDRFCRLPCREIENLLTPDTISAIIRAFEKVEPQLNSFAQDDYRNESLGRFIEERVLTAKPTLERGYADESGTIKQKTLFCGEGIKHMESFDSLSAGAQDLTKKLYAFIAASNPHCRPPSHK